MALLRESSKATGEEIDAVSALTDTTSDAGVPHGRALRRFATTAAAGSSDLPGARASLESAIGRDGMQQAAMTIAAFSGLVRVADATGIQVDATTYAITAREREAMAIDGYAGAANTEVDVTSVVAPDHFDNAYELFR